MSKTKDNGLFWDIKRPMSYHCLYNFIVGMRGCGKTTGSLIEAIKRFNDGKKHGERNEFIYLRRYGTELENLTTGNNGRLMNTCNKIFTDRYFSAKNDRIYQCIDGEEEEQIGWAVPLSTASIFKSDSFPDVGMIIFDEFIIDNTGTYHYLKDEIRKFLDFYETVARPGSGHKRVDVFFLSNAVTVSNPYFDFYHLDKPFNGDIQRFGKAKLILVQNVVNQALVDAKTNTDFYKINADTEYYDYAVTNDWLLDNTDFIEKKTWRSEYYVSIRYNDSWLGVWRDGFQGLFYVSNDVDLQFPHKYSATTDDHKPNLMLFTNANKLPWLKQLKQAYEMGCVRYESIKLKNQFRDIMCMGRR